MFMIINSKIHPDDWNTWLVVWMIDEATVNIDPNLWAIYTMTSIGFGNILPETYGEKITAIFVLILGVSFI